MNTNDKGTHTIMRLGKIKRIPRLFWTKKRLLKLAPISSEASNTLTRADGSPPYKFSGMLLEPLHYHSLNDFILPGSTDFSTFLRKVNKSCGLSCELGWG
jgi:hypothetical protein